MVTSLRVLYVSHTYIYIFFLHLGNVRRILKTMTDLARNAGGIAGASKSDFAGETLRATTRRARLSSAICLLEQNEAWHGLLTR